MGELIFDFGLLGGWALFTLWAIVWFIQKVRHG